MDKIVAMTQFRDYILVITEHGCVYRIVGDDFARDIQIQQIARIQLGHSA